LLPDSGKPSRALSPPEISVSALAIWHQPRWISDGNGVSRYLPAYRIEGQKKDKHGLFAKARQR
jgi:hypothetical protein